MDLFCIIYRIFAGGTVVGRGTVQMSIRAGIDYLYEIAKSLLKQGFRRQVYVTCHGPAYLTISPVIRDFLKKQKRQSSILIW